MSILALRRQREPDAPPSGTTWLRIVGDAASPSTGDQALTAIVNGLGHSLLDTITYDYGGVEDTRGDFHVVCPSVATPLASAGGPYIGQNRPTFGMTVRDWPIAVGFTDSNIKQIDDGSGARYHDDSLFSWTGQTLGQNVTYQTGAEPKWWENYVTLVVGGQVVPVSNTSFPTTRASSVAVDAGAELQNGDTDRERLMWLGWHDTLELGSLTADGEQFIRDAITWIAGP